MFKRSIILPALAVLAFLIYPLFSASAQNDFVTVNTPNPNFQTIQDITPSDYITTLLNILLGTAGVASFVFLIIGGVRWITAGGDKEATEKARKYIVNALIGLTIVFSSYAILFIVRQLFNVNLIKTPLSQLGTISTGGYPPSGDPLATPDPDPDVPICVGTECDLAIPITNGSCPCGGAMVGFCAPNGTLASTEYYGTCYLCTDSLWVPVGGEDICAPISYNDCTTCY